MAAVQVTELCIVLRIDLIILLISSNTLIVKCILETHKIKLIYLVVELTIAKHLYIS